MVIKVSTKINISCSLQICSIVSLQKALTMCNYQLIEDVPIISRLNEARQMVKQAKNLDERVEALQLLVSTLQECANPSLLPKTLKLAGFTLTLQAGAYRFETVVEEGSRREIETRKLLDQVSRLRKTYENIQDTLEENMNKTLEMAGRAKSEQERLALVALCQAAREADDIACENRKKEIYAEIERIAPKLSENVIKTKMKNGTIQYVLIYN